MNQAADAALLKLSREHSLAEERIAMLSASANAANKEKKELSTQLRSIERALSNAVAEFEQERTRLATAYEDKIADLSLEGQGLKRLVQSKSKEIAYLKHLGRGILDARGEIERFLLESISDVKAEALIRKKAEEAAFRHSAAVGGSRTGSKGGTVILPSLSKASSASGLLGHQSKAESPAASQPAAPKVDLNDLSLAEREKVLRVLFSKINRASKPSHMRGEMAGDAAASRRERDDVHLADVDAEDEESKRSEFEREDDAEGSVLEGLAALGGRAAFA